MPASSSPSTRAGRSFDVTYFRANLTDKINGFFSDPVIGNFTAINLPGESTREGVEVSARFKLARNLTLGGAYTYTDARDPNGEREVRRPPHSARADVAYAFCGGRGTATLGAIYNGRMDDIALPSAVLLPARSAWSSTTTGSSTPRPPTSCSRAWRCSAGWRICSISTIKRCSASNAAPIAAYRGRQADVRRTGRHRRRSSAK